MGKTGQTTCIQKFIGFFGRICMVFCIGPDVWKDSKSGRMMFFFADAFELCRCALYQ